jgi:hypothetical protein
MAITPQQREYANEALRLYAPLIDQLIYEIRLLMIESEGLAELASKLRKANDKNRHEERFEHLYWRFSDNGSRYHGMMMQISETIRARQDLCIVYQNDLREAFRKAGMDVSDFPETNEDSEWPEFLDSLRDL